MINDQRLSFTFFFFLLFCAVYSFQSTNYLPWGADLVKGKEMPLPMGLGLTYYFQDQDYKLDKISLDIDIFDPQEIKDQIKIINNTKEMNLKLDMWLLPFLNLFGMFGKVEADTDVDLGVLYNDIRIEYDGLVYGVGSNLALGWKALFANLNATYTETKLDQTDSSVEAWVISPKIGLHFNDAFYLREMSIWSGGMYQDYDERHIGKFDAQGIGVVEYDITLAEQEAWNYLIGLQAGLSKHLTFELEGGFGNRNQLASSITYRF